MSLSSIHTINFAPVAPGGAPSPLRAATPDRADRSRPGSSNSSDTGSGGRRGSQDHDPVLPFDADFKDCFAPPEELNQSRRQSLASHRQKSFVDVASRSSASGKDGGHRHSHRGHGRLAWIKRYSRILVSNKFFIALTTVLTIYALVGDDIRLLATNKPADDWFNAVTLFCIAVFTFEIVISCLGRDDYIFSFFMTLDIVSTMTLPFDLTYVNEYVQGDGEDLEKMRSGRTARVGAKAGRVVRVIRLVRILKLYKAFYEAAQKKMRDKNEEDEWDEIETTKGDDKLEESRVGKKLSKTTTRRVIILVLTMLLVLPFLRAQSSDNYPESPYYGADEVFSAYKEMADRPTWDEGLIRYEKALLKYLYYHNWFVGRSDFCQNRDYSCSSWYYSHVFYVGLISSDESKVASKVNSTRLRLSSVLDWNEWTAQQDDIYKLGTMPPEVLSVIGGEWTACNQPKKGLFRRGFSLIGKELEDPVTVSYTAPCPDDLRNIERKKFYPRLLSTAAFEDWHFAFYFDTRPFVQAEAFFGMCITVFICIVLCLNSLQLSNDANKLVLHPLENMIKRVNKIRSDPLIAMQMADEEFKLELKQRAKLTRHNSERFATLRNAKDKCTNCIKHTSEPEGVLETVVLEKTIIKLGSLLALGFGEAGASIIGHNLACSDSAGVNVMIPGRNVEAIVGKARINDFSIATEVLQARVMTFVNQIAEIIHGVVNEFNGCANKNNGDTFLLIWRTSGAGVEDSAELTSKFADMSMMAFAKILGAVHRAPVLAAYRAHPRLQQRLGTNTRVNLTFGLHSGWAIEGAVGSEFKIDASYLSPNVSLASSIEAATKVYKVPILLSQDVVDHQSSAVADKCRLIDRVRMKGSAEPIRLYSLDLDYLSLTVDAPRDPNLKWNLRERFKARQFLEVEKQRKFEVYMAEEFETSRDICSMRRRYTTGFLQMFHMGFQNYINGEWQVAKRLLSNASQMLRDGDDGPCQALLTFMKKCDFQAPEHWQGIREFHHFQG